MATKPIPDGYATITPYLVVKDAAAAIDFYVKAFGAIELYRLADPQGGRIGHAELLIGTSRIMLADEYPERDFRGPQSLKGTPVSFLIYVEDADSRFNHAIALGATLQQPVKDQFYGDRSGSLLDPFGHHWTIATRIENVEPDEIKRRFAAVMKSVPGS
jgi:PhnB protein